MDFDTPAGQWGEGGSIVGIAWDRLGSMRINRDHRHRSSSFSLSLVLVVLVHRRSKLDENDDADETMTIRMITLIDANNDDHDASDDPDTNNDAPSRMKKE